ncbi:hypothetical protein [Aureimonas mangrovi]|uniref:hypothetical protein n=1 Tax=Aureimonas mangrovi TaxID=2758041 RepID=UPI00163DBC4C|nr:hypothetical protein [Aureimonas mangrovi]
MTFTLCITQGAGEYPLGPFTRREIELQIETLISALDAFDGDPDLEPDPDGEPSLGWTRTMAWGGANDLEAAA